MAFQNKDLENRFVEAHWKDLYELISVEATRTKEGAVNFLNTPMFGTIDDLMSAILQISFLTLKMDFDFSDLDYETYIEIVNKENPDNDEEGFLQAIYDYMKCFSINMLSMYITPGLAQNQLRKEFQKRTSTDGNN